MQKKDNNCYAIIYNIIIDIKSMTNINKFIIIYSFLLIFNNHTMIYRKQNSIENIIQKKIIDLGSSIHKKLASGGESLQRFFINTKENLVDSLSNLWKNHKWAIGGGTSLAAIIGFLVYNNKKKTKKQQRKINTQKTDNIIYLSNGYLNSITNLRMIGTGEMLEGSGMQEKLIQQMNTIYKPITFEINKEEENNTDQVFNDIILGMIAINDLMKFINTEYKKASNKITFLNYFTISLYFNIIKMIEDIITQRIKEYHQADTSTLIRQIKKNFWYFFLANNEPWINSDDYLKNGMANIKIEMNKAVFLPTRNQSAVDEVSSVLFFFKNNIYEEINKKKDDDNNINKLKPAYIQYKNKLCQNSPKSSLLDLIKYIKENHEKWVKNIPSNQSAINNVQNEADRLQIIIEMTKTQEL